MRNMICGAVVLIAAVVIAACPMGDQGDDGDRSGGLTAVRFASDSIAAVPDTAARNARVAGGNWENNDTIGVFMVNTGLTTVEGGAENIAYSTTSTGPSGNFTHSGSSTIYYPLNVATKVDFIAYYPHTSSITNWIYPVSVPADQTDQNGQPPVDLMWAEREDNGGTGFDKTYAGNVTLGFVHKLVKLVFDITAVSAEGVTETFLTLPDDLEVKITGQQISGECDLSTGILTPATAAPTEISAKTAIVTTTTATAEAIVLPNTGVSGMTFSFETSAGVYVVDVPAPASTNNQWEGGNKYTYTVRLQRSAVQIQGTVGSWGDGGSDTIPVKPKFPNP